jgi:hypothetical protein
MYSGSYSIANGEAGNDVSLFLMSVNDGTNYTSFYVDTISLTAVCCGAPCN